MFFRKPIFTRLVQTILFNKEMYTTLPEKTAILKLNSKTGNGFYLIRKIMRKLSREVLAPIQKGTLKR